MVILSLFLYFTKENFMFDASATKINLYPLQV